MLVYHFEGVPRRPLAVALKNILTLGIHTKVWLYRINREMDGHEGFHIDFRWLTTMVVLPILTPIVVKFQTARRMDQMVSHQLTLARIRPRVLGWISVVPVLGSGFYAYWVQHTLNRHWFWHRREEQIRLAKERIKRIEAAPHDPKDAERIEACRTEIETLEAEIAAELEAAKVRLGEERFAERERIAAEYASVGRMSRKELAEMRKARKARRKGTKAKKKGAKGADEAEEAEETGEAAPEGPKEKRGILSALRRTPEEIVVDEDGEPVPETPRPERLPEEILALADAEDRPLTEEEDAELKESEKLLAQRENELKRLRKALKKQRAAEEKEAKRRAKEEAKAEKAAAKAEGKKPKKAKKKVTAEAKPPKKAKKGKKAKTAKTAKKGGKADAGPAEEAPKGIPVKQKPGRPGPAAAETGAGPLKVLSLKCPRCEAQIENVAKRGDAPAKVTCPECGLVGKV